MSLCAHSICGQMMSVVGTFCQVQKQKIVVAQMVYSYALRQNLSSTLGGLIVIFPEDLITALGKVTMKVVSFRI